MVRGAVVVSIPPHVDKERDETVNPEGNTSLNETPPKGLVLGLVSVKARVLVLPVPIEVGKKLLERFGTVGREQPVITMLSRYTVDVAFALFLVSAWMVNLVVLLPVVAAVAVAPVCHKPFVVAIVVAAENAPPSALE
jgi:hypothetical protein